MQSTLSFFITKSAAILQRLLDTSTVDDDEVRKTGFMYAISLIGIFFLTLLGSIAFIQGGLLLGALDFTVALILTGVLFFLRIREYFHACICTSVTVLFFLYLYLFISGGIAGNAFLWSYTLPIFAFFLLGTKKGFIISSLFFLSCLAVIIVDLSSSLINLYSRDFAIRFVPSFATVIILSLIYEKFRENSQQALVDSRNSLEIKVAERTEELQKEIQNRKLKEQELRISELRYRTLYNNSSDAISIISLGGRYISANQQFCNKLGYSEEELKNMAPPDIYRDGTTISVTAKLNEIFMHGSAQFEADQVDRDGKYFPVEIRAQRITFDSYVAVLCSCRDTSERKRQEEENEKLQKELFRASKMEAIGMMAGGVAHDLNNILAGIISYPELLLLRLPESSELRKPIKAIHESGKRAATVVADLLTVARGAATTREPCDINKLVDEFFNSPEHQTREQLHTEVVCTKQLRAEHPVISCSPMHIKKTVMNLIINAMEAIGDKGNILVSTCNRQVRENDKLDHNLTPGNYVVLSVHDDGPGITGQDLEHIFEPFYTKKMMDQSGTGLGLTIVWNTVQDHDGRIFVNSSPKGTQFQLYFPASMADSKVETVNTTIDQDTGNNEHILVVDDDPQLRDIASQMLQAMGYVTDSVHSGELAIEFLKKNPSDLVLLDMLMEPGINGRQTYEEIIKIYPNQRAIIASGFAESDDIEAALQLGANGFIKKPYSMAQFGRAVREALDS